MPLLVEQLTQGGEAAVKSASDTLILGVVPVWTHLTAHTPASSAQG